MYEEEEEEEEGKEEEEEEEEKFRPAMKVSRSNLPASISRKAASIPSSSISSSSPLEAVPLPSKDLNFMLNSESRSGRTSSKLSL